MNGQVKSFSVFVSSIGWDFDELTIYTRFLLIFMRKTEEQGKLAGNG